MRKRAAGFTLIELIVVIVILGIVAAVALPKFVDLGTDARKASAAGLDGSMRAANSLIYAKAAAAGTMGNATTAATVTVNGASVSVEYGFANSVAELVKVMDLSTNDFDSTTVATEIQLKKAPTPGSCKVAYAKASATAAATYTQTLTGC